MIYTSSIHALRNNRKWAIGLKKSPFISTVDKIESKQFIVDSSVGRLEPRDLPVIDKWMISLKNGPEFDLATKKSIKVNAEVDKIEPKQTVLKPRNLPVIDKWMVSLKNGPEFEWTSKKRYLANVKPDIFNFEAKEETLQAISCPENDQDEELYRGIDILLTAHTPQIIDSFAEFCKMVGEEFSSLGVEFDGFSNPRLHKDDWALNKSPFIYGRHMTSYEIRTYKKVVHFLYLTGTTREIMLNYIERNVPAGVGIEVKSFKLAQFPAELEKHIDRNFDTLSDEDKKSREEFLAMDDMELRKLDLAHYEMRRKPWNPTPKDYEQQEIMGFRRYYRQPATFGKI